MQEVRLLGRALWEEESSGASSRRLVLACHEGLLEQQQRIASLHAAACDAEWTRAHEQACLAAEVRGVEAMVARAGGEHRASLAMARRKAAAAAQEGHDGREAGLRWQRQCREQGQRGAPHCG